MLAADKSVIDAVKCLKNEYCERVDFSVGKIVNLTAISAVSMDTVVTASVLRNMFTLNKSLSVMTPRYLRIQIFTAMLLAFVTVLIPARQVQAGQLNLSDIPLFVEGNTTALLQLVLQRDNNPVSYTHLTLPTTPYV